MKLLLDFLPIILFFAIFKARGIYAATAVAIAATLIQAGYLYIKNRKIEPPVWISLAVITVFGGATLALHNEQFIKWKPTILYWIFGVVLLADLVVIRRNFLGKLMQGSMTLSDRGWRVLTLVWVAFFAFLGALNLFVAYTFSTDVWVNFKLFGIMGLLFAFIIGQSLVLGMVLKKRESARQPE